ALPANPFAVAVSPGAKHAFVSMPREGSRGIVALSAGSPWNVERVLWVKPPVVPRGLTVDRTGRHLLVANGAGGLLVADTARLLAGDENPFAASAPAPATGSMQVALHADQRFAFVSDEDSATV